MAAFAAHLFPKSRRGSYIAEAAAVLPFVILSVITTVLIIMFFYASSVSESRMHIALRCEAGILTGKSSVVSAEGRVLAPDDLWDGSISSSGAVTSKRVVGSKSVSMVSGGLLSRPGRRELTGELRAVDPVRSLRLRQIVQPSPETEEATEDVNEAAEGEAL